MAGPESLATGSPPPAVTIGPGELAMLLELIARVAHATLPLALVPLATAFLVRALELRDLLLRERPLELLLQLLE